MSGNKTAPQTSEPAASSPDAVRRERRLLIVFSLLLSLWIAAMIAMYVATVYPQRHPLPVPASSPVK